MKKQPILFVVLIGLICLTQTTLSQQCIEFETPLDKSKYRVVDCKPKKPNKRQTPAAKSPDNMFVVNFTCFINDKTLCDKVQNVFISAGKYITATLNLKTPVTVNAKFLDLCQQVQGGCSPTEIILGAAGPARLVPFTDTDGKTRLYPQALFKQLNLPQNTPSIGQGNEDIQAVFNTRMNYWFRGDPTPMPKAQVDMLYVVLHELVHGMGFTTSWDDYANIQALTPIFGPSIDQPPKGQFLELLSDKFLVLLPSGKRLTSITDELNNFQFTTNMPDAQIITSFMKSPQFAIAQQMFKQAQTPDAMGFMLSPNLPDGALTPDQIKNDILIAETSLVPFQSSSSIAHVDLKTYLNSQDFLMMFTYPPGKTLDDMMGGSGSTNTTGPIGPQLRRFLGMMGYQVNTQYIDPFSSSVQSNGTTPGAQTPPDSAPNGAPYGPGGTYPNGTSPAKSSDSPLVSFNLGLSLVFVLITLIHNIYFKY